MVIIFLAAPGRLLFAIIICCKSRKKATKTAVLSLTNVLFGIFTGVINFYYICSCEIHETAKNRKVLQCPKSKTLRYKHFSYLKNENRQLSEKCIEICAI